MSTKDKIRELLDEGLSPQEIADKAGVKMQTVYHYRYLFKKEDEPSKAEESQKRDEIKRKEERKMNKLERENKTLKAELGASEKELEQALSEYEDLETIAINLQEMNATGTKDSHENQVNQRIEELEHENRRLKNHNGKQSEELYKREQYINELRDELEAERTKHSHLSNYTRLIMQGEGAANV